MMKALKVVVSVVGMAFVGSLAQADSMYIDQTGLVGVGTNTPDKQIHVVGPTGAPEALYKLEHTDVKKVRFSFVNPNGAMTFDMSADAKTFSITKVGVGPMLQVTDTGELYVKGVLAFDATP